MRASARLTSHRITPPDAPAHDHGDGRSPGSRVLAWRRLPGEVPVASVTQGSPLTVAGAAAALGSSPAPHSLLIPNWEPSPRTLDVTRYAVNRARAFCLARG